MGEIKISILSFADDIVLINDSDINLQRMLNVVNNWCQKWRLTVNKDKTKVVHFRNPQQPRAQNVFKYGIDVLEIFDKYKYLGTVLNEYLHFNVIANVLAGAGGRALNAVISKFSNLNILATQPSQNYFKQVFHQF